MIVVHRRKEGIDYTSAMYAANSIFGVDGGGGNSFSKDAVMQDTKYSLKLARKNAGNAIKAME